MSEWDGLDNRNNESGEVVEESATAEENPAAETAEENLTVEEGTQTDEAASYNSGQDWNNPYIPYGGQIPPSNSQGNQYNYEPYNNPYNGQYNNQYNSQYNNNSYSNSQYNNPYSDSQQNYNPYNNPYNSQYNNNAYNNGSYNNQYNNPQYNRNPYGNNPYAGQIPQNGNQGSPYHNNPYNSQYNNNPYGNDPHSNNPYNNNPYNNQYNNNPYNNNNPYSPYTVPPKKNKTGLIIGIVIGIVVLLLIVVFALAYRAMTLLRQVNIKMRNSRNEYQFDYDDDDWGLNRYWKDNDSDYGDDWYDGYGDWYDYNNDDSQYYDLHDDIREDLSYSVDMDYYEYDEADENVDVLAEYPIIQGNVPNLGNLNDVIRGEVDSFISYFEEEYKGYITGDDNYEVFIQGYVTYMDEDKISIVFDERVYSYDYSDYIDVYLCCINVDMENGVVLENQNMLRIDDDFSVDFREKSDIQNGEVYYMSMMSDQEITDHFNSTDVIVFYTPMGMEIGFNYAEGWITVTYSEYEQYLKVF